MMFSACIVLGAVGCFMAIPSAQCFSVPRAISHKSIAVEAASCRHDDNSDQSPDRRTFLLLGSAFLATTTAGVMTNTPPAMADDSTSAVDYKAVAADVAKLITEAPDKGPTLVRLAWHSSGTYDKMSKTGGSGGGTIRFKEELDHGGNAGLAATAVEWMEPIHKAHPGISYADLYTLGGGKEVTLWGWCLFFNSSP
jgi:catalase (peroxidase I)